ncbi:MAG: exported protein of unknown function [Rhodoferax sp.]|nr:exported protein of unknown function [Rhodoferax sp.]
MTAFSAQAQFATGGTGLYRNSILWFQWGTAPENISEAGTVVTNNFSIAGASLAVSCGLSGISGSGPDPDLDIYRPGTYFEDGLDDLYNIGGADIGNTMDIGLRTRTDGTNAKFNFSCSATLNGAAYPLLGLVFADAETTSEEESTVILPPAGATLRIIERLRGPGCDEPYYVDNNSGSFTFRTGPAPISGEITYHSCYLTSGPSAMAIAFLDNATSATVTINGAGQQAVAVGVMISVGDYGDAPSSYGVAAHIPQYSWRNGTVDPGTNEIFPATAGASTFALATRMQPTTALLGSRVDVEATPHSGVGATGDDTTSTDGTNDEDGVNMASLAPLTRTLAGQSYQVPVSCVGSAPTAGWIDFDRSGVFDQDERSATVNCSGGTALLTWTVNADIVAGLSYLRVRTAVNASDIAAPTGFAGSGEVEDYAITIHDPKIRVAKTTIGSVGGPFTFVATNTATQPGPLTTSAIETAVVGNPVSIPNLTTNVVLTEGAPAAGWVTTAIACTNADTGLAFSPTYDLANRRVTVPAASLGLAADISCTFTNTKQPIVRLNKVLPGGRLVAADQFTLSIAGAGGPVTTTTTGTGSTAAEVATLAPASTDTAYTLSETAAAGANLADYATAYSCVNGRAGGQTPSGSGPTLTMTLAAGDDLTCSLSNTAIPRADLSVAKLASPASVQSGQIVTFTLTVVNNGPSAADGAILRDIASAELDCNTPDPTATCTASGGAACPGATVPVASLLGTAGVSLPALPSGGQVVVTLKCKAVASGI